MKIILSLLRLNNPFLSNGIQATLPEKNLYFFLNSIEGRIFKKSFDYLNHSPLQQKNTTTVFQPSPSSQYLQRSNSICSYMNTKENNSQISQNILNEITSSIQSRVNKSLTRNNSLSNAKSVAPLPMSILKNKGQVHNLPVISTSQITKTNPNESANQVFNTTAKSINQSQNYTNQSSRSITPTRAPLPTADTQFNTSHISTISKAPYLNFSTQNEYNQPLTPIGKSIFDQNQNEDTLNKQILKTPASSSIINSIIGTNSYIINNNIIMTPNNQNLSQNIIQTVNIQPQLSSSNLSSTLQNPIVTQLTIGSLLNNVTQQFQNNVDRSRSITPTSYLNSQTFGSSMFTKPANSTQQYPITPSDRIKNNIDIQNTITPVTQTQFINHNSQSLNNEMQIQKGLNTPQNYPISQKLNDNQSVTDAQNIYNQSITQPLSNTVNINIGQLLSQRSSITQSKIQQQTQSFSQAIPDVIPQNKQSTEFIPSKQIIVQNKIDTKSLTPQNSSSNILRIIRNNSSSISSQGNFTQFILQNDQSQNNLTQASIYQNTSAINQGSVIPTLSTPTASALEKQYTELKNQDIPFESVRNKFQQLRKITGVRKASEVSLSPINKEKNDENNNNNSNKNFNFFKIQNNEKPYNIVQKSRSISNLNYNQNNYNDMSNSNNSRFLSEVPPSFINNASSSNNFIKNKTSEIKGLKKTFSCSNINSFQNQGNNNCQQQPEQKRIEIPYYFGRQSTSSNNNNGISKNHSILPSLSNISQIMFTQEDQSKSIINLGGLPSTKIQNSFLPCLSPIYKNNQGVENSRSFFQEALPLVANNNIFATNLNNQNEEDKLICQPNNFNFNQSYNVSTPINNNNLNTKQDKDVKDNTKDSIYQIIQRTVTREFEKMKQEAEEATQNELDKNQRKFSEFSMEQDQKQFLQSLKNNEILNQTLSDLQNSFRQNTIESICNKNRQSSSYNEHQFNILPPPRYPANSFRNIMNNSIQTSSSTNFNNIFCQKSHEGLFVANKENQNSLRSNRFNNSQQDEDRDQIKKTSINNGLNNQQINEVNKDKQAQQGRNSQDFYDIQNSLKISEINKPIGQDQNNYGMNIIQAGGSVSSTFNDLNSFVCRNLESQRQVPYFNLSSDNQLSSARMPQNNLPILTSQLQNIQHINQYNSTPKNQIESYQQNTLSYSGTNTDITLKKFQNTQSIQVDQPKNNNSQYPNYASFSSEFEQTPTSQTSNFPSTKLQFNNNLINSNKISTPNRKDSIQISTVQSQNTFSQQLISANNQDIYNRYLHNNDKETDENEITPKNNNQLRYQSQCSIKIEDNGIQQEKKKQFSSGEINFFTSINEFGLDKNNNLQANPNERQRNISIISDLQTNNQTPQKLINTASKQKMFDEIERLKNNGGQISTIQFVTNQEMENIKANANNYWNNCNSKVTDQECLKQNQNLNWNIDSIFNKISSTQISGLGQNNYLDFKTYKQSEGQSSQNLFKAHDANDFQIQSNIYNQDLKKQTQTHQNSQTNNLQNFEMNLAFQKPPLQNLKVNRSQKPSQQQIQKLSLQKQSSLQFSNSSSPGNQIKNNQQNIQPHHTSNNSSLSQISSNNLNSLSPSYQQQLIASSQEYRMNLKNSQPSNNSPQLQQQVIHQQHEEHLSSLNQKQLKSYNNFQENYSYAYDGQQLLNQQTPQQNSNIRIQYLQSADQNYDQMSDEDDVENFRPLEEKDLREEQCQDEMENYHQQQNNGYLNQMNINCNNTYSQMGNLQKYMTNEQIMRLNQQQQLIHQQQQQLNQGQDQYYDDLDSNIEEDEAGSDEISYQQQNISQNEQEVQYYNNLNENEIQEEDLQYEHNFCQLQNQEQQEFTDQIGQSQLPENIQYNNQFYQQQLINQKLGQINMNNQDYNMYQKQNFISNNRDYHQQQLQSVKLPTFNNENYSTLQQEEFNETNSIRESIQNKSLRSSKNYLCFSGKRLEENFSSVKKTQNGLYNQKINFDGDKNFKLNDQPLLENNIYQSEGFQFYQNNKNKLQSNQQYQSLQLNFKLNPQNIQQYQDQIPLMGYQQRALFQQENDYVDEEAEDQLSLSQISQSPLTPSQLQHIKRNSYQQYQEIQQDKNEDNYQEDEQNLNYHDHLQQYQEREFQSRISNENLIQYNLQNQIENMDQEQNHIITNKNYIQRNSRQNPQTRDFNISDVHIFQNNDQFKQETDKQISLQRKSQGNSHQKTNHIIDKNNFEIYTQIPKNFHEFHNYEEHQQQYFGQQNKVNTQQTQEESTYEDHMLSYLNNESENKNRLRSQNKDRINEANSQERLSQRQLSQRQNSSRYLTSAENVSKKNISRRIFNQSARQYNELIPSDSTRNQKNQNLQQFEAEQKNKAARESIQDYLQELNEISGRSARGILDLSHRIQQSNSFILDRSTMNEKSFYQNDKSFQQNERSFNQIDKSPNQNDKSPNMNEKSFNLNNQMKSQNDIDDSFQNDNTVLTGGCYSTKKENYKNTEQRISEYTIRYNNQNEVQKEDNSKIENEKSTRNETGSTTLFENPLLQNNTSYQPSTLELRFPNQQERDYQQNFLTHFYQQNNDELSNDQPFIITTKERRRSNDRVDEISINYKDLNLINHPSFNQEQIQQFQQQNYVLNNQQQEQGDGQKDQLNYNLNNIQKDSFQDDKLQNSPYIDETNKKEKSQVEALQITSFAHSDNFISFQQTNNSTSTLPPSNNKDYAQINVPINHNSDIFNPESRVNEQNEFQQQNKFQSSPQVNNLTNLNNKENQQFDTIIEKEENIKQNQSIDSKQNCSQFKKSSSNLKTRPISDIPTESKFIKQRQPHFEDSSNKESHSRSQSNHLKKKKNFELSIEACNEVQNKQLQHHGQGENKETPQFQESVGNPKTSGLFKSKKSILQNKREQSMSFLEYQKSMTKNNNV